MQKGNTGRRTGVFGKHSPQNHSAGNAVFMPFGCRKYVWFQIYDEYFIFIKQQEQDKQPDITQVAK